MSPGAVIFVGRDSNCQLPLKSREHPLHISRKHVELRLCPEGKRLTVRDLRSANGSFLNGDRLGLEETEWTGGDRLQIGTTGEFVLEVETEESVELKSLRDSTEGAKRRRRKFLNFFKIARPEDLKLFSDGLSRLTQRDAKKFFLSLVGLTRENVKNADRASIDAALKNLGFPGNSKIDKILAFMDGETYSYFFSFFQQ